MTTPPRARKFRIRRVAAGETAGAAASGDAAAPETGAAAAPAAGAATGAADDPAGIFTPAGDGFGAGPFPTAAPPAGSAPAPDTAPAGAPETAAAAAAARPQTIEEELARIRAEGLTARQLRMARRVAQKHGIETDSDVEAVRQLRRRGIDPFQRANMLELVIGADPATAEDRPAGARVQLPQTVPAPERRLPAPGAPGLDPGRGDARAAEILRIQQDIARRRRRKLLFLFARLAVFVFLPTLVAGWYYSRIATPTYATRSEFVIQKADSQPAGGLGSMFAGTQLATNQDSITVQGYLQSREAMLRLDQDLGFRAHWSAATIDAIQRLAPDATDEAAYRLYKRTVKIGFDPTEGIVKLEVSAADPALSAEFSRALIRYAEEQVDQLTSRLREDQMTGARDSYADAEAKVQAAQARVLALQEKLGVLDPASESGVVMTQISTFEVQLQEKRLALRQLLDNAQPNAARRAGIEGDIARLEKLVAELRASLTQSTGSTASLAVVTGQLRIAEADLETRQLMLSQAAGMLETARIEANKQVRYLSMGVSPIAPDEPSYPRAFENTLVAFLIFAGLYLMLSLTASILREQVSA